MGAQTLKKEAADTKKEVKADKEAVLLKKAPEITVQQNLTVASEKKDGAAKPEKKDGAAKPEKAKTTNKSAKKKNKEVIKAAVAAAAKKIDATANQIAHEDPKKVEIKNLETEAGKVAVELKGAEAELLESKKTKEEETVQKKAVAKEEKEAKEDAENAAADQDDNLVLKKLQVEKKAEEKAEPAAEKKAEEKVEPAAEKKAEEKVEPVAEKKAEEKVEPASEQKAEPSAEPAAEK